MANDQQMTFGSNRYSAELDRGKVVRGEKGQFISPDPLYQPRKIIEGALKRAAKRSPEALDRACNALLDSAAYGETWQERIAAFREVADRLDGKAVARIETNDTDSRNMGLADLVALVLQARKADAIDAPTLEQSNSTPSTEPAE